MDNNSDGETMVDSENIIKTFGTATIEATYTIVGSLKNKN